MTRFVYIDEAGISNPNQEPFVVVAGVIVHADKQLNELESRLKNLITKHIPKNQQEGFVFHATELFNGGGRTFKREDWPLEQRLEIARKLAQIPGKMGLPMAFGIVQRAQWPQTFDGSALTAKEKAVGQHVTAYMSCIMQVELWMRTKAPPNEVTIMIVEDNDQARSLIRETQNEHRKSNLSDLPPDARKYFPLSRIKQSPLFERKDTSPALQLADFCAYVMKKRTMNDNKYAEFVSALQPHYAIHDLPDEERPANLRRRKSRQSKE